MLSCLVLLCAVVGSLCAPTTTPPFLDAIVNGMFQAGDKNKDGIYSKAEAWASILQIDTDGDSKVSLSEYVRRWTSVDLGLGNLATGLFATFDFDKSGFIERSDLNRAYALIDLDSNGQISSAEFSKYMKTVLSGLFSPTQTTPAPVHVSYNQVLSQLIEASFPQIDTNKDGFISFEEDWADVKRYDVNGDDKISKVEFMQVLANLSMGSAEMWPDMFDAFDGDGNRFLEKPEILISYNMMDADHNSKVSKSEVLAVFKHFDQMVASLNTSTDQIDFGFGESDANHDGFVTLSEEWANTLTLDKNLDNLVSLAEFQTMFAYYNRDVVNAARRIFNKYDKNSDGFFQKSDIADFFSDMDDNGDGLVTRNVYVTFIEVMFANQGVDIRAASIALSDATYQAYTVHLQASPWDKELFDVRQDMAEIAPLAAQQNADFGFSQIDSNHDNMVSLDEEWASLMNLDKNDDQKLSKVEYVASYETLSPEYKAAGPKVFDKADLNNNSFLERSDIAAGFKIMDTSGDGLLSMSEYLTALKNVFGSVGVNVSTPNSGSNRDEDYGFSEVDTNNDKLISLEEEWASLMLLDSNGDNKLSKAEYLTRYANLPADFKAAGPKIFDKADVNKNGFLDKSDIVAGIKAIDTSGDGSLSLTEYLIAVQNIYESVGIHLNITFSATITTDHGFSKIDSNKDGQVTFDEVWSTLIKLLDTNGDGRVNLKEYEGAFNPNNASVAPKIFAKFDSDKDGFFDRAGIRKFVVLADSDGNGALSAAEYSSFVVTLLTSMGLTNATTPAP